MALRHLLHHLLPLPSLLSTLSLISLARLAIHLPRWLLLLLIPLQFTFLSLLTYLNAPKGVAWTKWEQLGKRDEVVLALHLVGGTGAVVWGVRGTPVGVVLVLETFLLPAMLLLPSQTTCHSSNTLLLAYLLPPIATMLLLGRYAMFDGSILVLGNVLLEASRRTMLERREALDREVSKGFFLNAAVTATLISSTLYFLLFLTGLLSDGWFSSVDQPDILHITTYTLSSCLYTYLTFPSASSSSSSSQTALTTATTQLFPRNLLTLVGWSYLNLQPQDLAGLWLSHLVVYSVGFVFHLTASSNSESVILPLSPFVPSSPLAPRRSTSFRTSPFTSPATSPSVASPSFPKPSTTTTTTTPHHDHSKSTSSFIPPPLSNTTSLPIFQRHHLPFTFLPLLLYLLLLLTPPSPSSPTTDPLCRSLPSSPPCLPPTTIQLGSIDVVISYYDEPIKQVRQLVDRVRRVEFVALRKGRVVVYAKGGGMGGEKENGWEERLSKRLGVEEVVGLENRGREGGTYLQHIIKRYQSTINSLADPSLSLPPSSQTLATHTLFLQPHIAWGATGRRRLELFTSETGFLSLGPYSWTGLDGVDGKGTGRYERLGEVVRILKGKLGDVKEGEEFLTAFQGQFIVSRKRILANELKVYEKLDRHIEAPEGDRLHQDWGPNGSGGPSNPTFGHVVERAWPFIFGCSDAELARRCTDRVWRTLECQCFD